ncbi:MAG TPA: hypothetical protein VD866_23650, partial [Urbifossiella sp.]|nr:hypothetical protein [Urbifossiella sp.]
GVIPATVGSGAHPAENPDWGDGSLLLTSGWQQFRLAAGPHEAAEMLRDLVCAALAQARRQLGRGV